MKATTSTDLQSNHSERRREVRIIPAKRTPAQESHPTLNESESAVWVLIGIFYALIALFAYFFWMKF
jgi:hypothetical protein